MMLTLLHSERPKLYTVMLTLLHSERPKLYTILASLSATGLNPTHHTKLLMSDILGGFVFHTFLFDEFLWFAVCFCVLSW